MEKFKKILMSETSFIWLLAIMTAGVMASSTLFATDGVGSMGSIAFGLMMEEALASGDWGAIVGFAGGFLIARVLEGPLVGILDIGGSIMFGVAFGVFGLIASSAWGAAITTSFAFSLLCGAVVGGLIGAVIIGVRRFIPAGVTASGTDIMIGVGHQLGVWLAPLVLIAALQYNMVAGIAAAIGGLIFHYRGKGMLGGIILGIFIIAFFLPVAA